MTIDKINARPLKLGRSDFDELEKEKDVDDAFVGNHF